MSKRAIILAGGKGTRLKPYTVTLPKPLVPIGDKSILEIIIKQLIDNGFNHVTITINHLADIIKAFFGDGSKWNIKIDYSLEEIPLNTMGPLKLINDLPQNFLIMNGDVLTNLNFSELYKYHVENKNIYTISSFKRKHKNDYGVLKINDNGYLVDFHEKPITEFIVSMGVYMANKEILNYIPENQAYGFDHLMLDLIKRGKNASVKSFDGYWLDIGRPDDYAKACKDIDKLSLND
ncbi:MAG: nucleoside-diphosphate-sugar pyrophosphorylase [Candidatus Marinimicrobia bacterium]|nr:nucleoside-diphosphate-sugar pyrophosphorylase [Candidatus Neomarinimicrobiota bacterium]|tara:strand:- start:1669 stop:2373 length:705 start_codon:yes stop_codon:yes gene_type:complete